MNNPIDSIETRWHQLTQEVEDAVHRAGRPAGSVQIIGVTKYVDTQATAQLFQAGCRRLGESRPQSLWEKGELLKDLPCEWHLIGTLQRNKVRKTLPYVSLIHSLDSVRLIKFIDATARESHAVVRGLLEVNISGDDNKQGLSPSDLLSTIDEIGELNYVRIMGLMAMAGLASTPAQAESQFAQLRVLAEKALARGLPEHVTLKELSMGMSDDFSLAVAQGATMVRIGSRLFPS